MLAARQHPPYSACAREARRPHPRCGNLNREFYHVCPRAQRAAQQITARRRARGRLTPVARPLAAARRPRTFAGRGVTPPHVRWRVRRLTAPAPAITYGWGYAQPRR